MAALLVLLLLLALSPTAFTTTDVYYVTAAGHEQSCPPHQICHNLSYYISQPDSYFTSDTTIIFMEGEHSFDREDLVPISNVNYLNLKGQGQWPVAGAEETVMQSTVIINCTRGRGGFRFYKSYDITVEGLTVVNCGGFDNKAVFYFDIVQSLFFHKNSIQHMTGYGLFVSNCDNVIVTNCSYYHSALCNINYYSSKFYGGGVGIDFEVFQAHYTLSHSNMTNCCSNNGGGIHLIARASRVQILFSHLILTNNRAYLGGGLAASFSGDGDVNANVIIRNSLFSHGFSHLDGGGMYFYISVQSSITIVNTNIVENFAPRVSEIHFFCKSGITTKQVSLLINNSNIIHTASKVKTTIKHSSIDYWKL